VAASDSISHENLDDFGAGGGFKQILRLKTLVTAEMMNGIQHSAIDVVLSAANAVLATSSDAVANLLKVAKNQFSSAIRNLV
jgi:hypothetical protein